MTVRGGVHSIICDYCEAVVVRVPSKIDRYAKDGKSFCSIEHRNLWHSGLKVNATWFHQSLASHCRFCRTEFLAGHKALWCQEACWRLNQVMSREEWLGRIEPSREKLEEVYGKDTPAWQGY